MCTSNTKCWDDYLQTNLFSNTKQFSCFFFVCLENGYKPPQELGTCESIKIFKYDSFDEEQTEFILAEADHIIVESQPRPMPEISWVLAYLPRTMLQEVQNRGNPFKKSGGLCQGPPLLFNISEHNSSRDPGHHNFAQCILKCTSSNESKYGDLLNKDAL